MTRQPSFAILEQTPRLIRPLLAAATPEQLDWQPAPDRWSIAMVLAHLADVEVHGFVNRLRAMIQEENPFLPFYDQMALFQSGSRFEGGEQLEMFAARRHMTLEWLRTLPEEAGTRAGRHEELGVITVNQLLNEFAFHDLGHIRQVAEIYRAQAFYPNMGPFQRYYQIHP